MTERFSVRPNQATPESRARRLAAIESALRTGGSPNNGDQGMRHLGGGDRLPDNSTIAGRIGNHPLSLVSHPSAILSIFKKIPQCCSGLRIRPCPPALRTGENLIEIGDSPPLLCRLFSTPTPPLGSRQNPIIIPPTPVIPPPPTLSQDKINKVITIYRALEALKYRDAEVQTDPTFVLLSHLNLPIKAKSNQTPMFSTTQTQFPAWSSSICDASGSSQPRPQPRPKIRAVIADSDDDMDMDLYQRLPGYPSEIKMEVDGTNPTALAPKSDDEGSGISTTSSPLDFPSDDEDMQADDNPQAMDTQKTLVAEREIDDDIYEPEGASAKMMEGPTDMDSSKDHSSEDEFQDTFLDFDSTVLDLILELNTPNDM